MIDGEALLKIDALENRAEELLHAACQDTGRPRHITAVEEMPPIGEEFTEALVAAAARIRVGGPEEAAADFRAINNPEHLQRILDAVGSRPSRVEVAVGGHTVGERGWFYAPTVLSGAQQDDAVIDQGIFGPVITVQSFDTEDQALAMADDVVCGLVSSVWISLHIPCLSEMPHGGFGHSGCGKDLSMCRLEDCTRVKHVMSCLGEPS